MSIKAACCVGCLVTVAILAGLFGIDGLLIYASDKADYDTMSAYNVNVSCNLTQVTVDGGLSSSSSCPVWHYFLEVGPMPGSNASLGLKQAYGNFFPGRCFGRYINSSSLGSLVTGCFTTSDGMDTDRVRITELLTPSQSLLIGSAVAVTVSVLIIGAFVTYNIVLWCGVCADVGPFSRERRLQREGRVDEHGNRVHPPERDPFDLSTIPVADKNWLAEITFDNPYSRAVFKRFAALDPVAKPHTPSPRAASVGPDQSTTAYDGVGAGGGEVELQVRQIPRDECVENTADDSDCCICYERFSEAIVFPCLHFVCTGCVEHLARTRVGELFICPMCRRNSFPVEMRRIRCRNDHTASAIVVMESARGEKFPSTPDESA